jgi:hypothetical protein
MLRTLFHNFGNSLVHATLLHGASVADLKDCQKALRLPEYDLYGAFFYQRKKMLDQLRKNLSTRKVNFEIFHDDATALAKDLTGRQKEDQGTFDRIDLSNTVDYMYLGIKTSVQTFIPLLKSKMLNPNATLLAYFMKATEQLAIVPSHLKVVEEQLYETLLQEEWLKQGPVAEMFYQAKRKQIQYILWNSKESFDSYCTKYNFDAAAEESKACMRDEPMIRPAWPMRHDFKDIERLREDIQTSLGPFSWADGNIRFAEWCRL